MLKYFDYALCVINWDNNHELNVTATVEAKNIDHAWKLVKNEGRKFWAEYKPTMQWPHDIGYEALSYDNSGEILKEQRFFS